MMLAGLFAFDCPADSVYRLDTRIRLTDGRVNPNYNQVITTGLGSCLDFAPEALLSDSSLSVYLLAVDNEPWRGFELTVVHSTAALQFDSLICENLLVGQYNIAVWADSNKVSFIGYSAEPTMTSGAGIVDTLFSLYYKIDPLFMAAADTINFWLEDVVIAGSNLAPAVLNTAAGYPDSLLPTAVQVTSVAAAAMSHLPDRFSLSQNYPNPFNPETTIRFAVPVPGRVEISIYNILGQLVLVLADRRYEPGSYSLIWDGTGAAGKLVASGIYLYEMRTVNTVIVKKMLYLR